jgi:hypothetical protein
MLPSNKTGESAALGSAARFLAFFSVAHIGSPLSTTPTGECSAITNRWMGENDLILCDPACFHSTGCVARFGGACLRGRESNLQKTLLSQSLRDTHLAYTGKPNPFCPSEN